MIEEGNVKIILIHLVKQDESRRINRRRQNRAHSKMGSRAASTRLAVSRSRNRLSPFPPEASTRLAVSRSRNRLSPLPPETEEDTDGTILTLLRG